jgi:hypothetical protein
MLLTSPIATRSDFEAGTGWALRSEGACLGEVCVPLPAGAFDGDQVDIPVVADRMGMPLLHDEEHGIWALGPWPGSGRTLVSVEAPDLRLPDLDGHEFSLSSLRGQKVLILAWAPY